MSNIQPHILDKNVKVKVVHFCTAWNDKPLKTMSCKFTSCGHVFKSTEHAETDCVKVVQTKCKEAFVQRTMPSNPTLTTVLTGFHTNMKDRKT